jgi:hypothetical protein
MPQLQQLAITQAEQAAARMQLAGRYEIDQEVILVPAGAEVKAPTWDGVRVFDPTANALVEANLGSLVIYSNRGVYDEAQTPPASVTVHDGDVTISNTSAVQLRLAFVRMTRQDYNVNH